MFPRSICICFVLPVFLADGLRTADACSCLFAPTPTIEEPFEGFDVVFLGVLSSQEPDYESDFSDPDDYRVINFEVVQSWKGATGTQIGILTEPGGSFAGCGLWGEVGDRFVIFANALTDQDGSLVTGCSRLRYGTPGATEYISALEDLGIESLELVVGDDPSYPPYRLFGGIVCGVGTFGGMVASLVGLLLLGAGRRFCSCSRQR